jgi:Xaa-Pro aminopeptidase
VAIANRCRRDRSFSHIHREFEVPSYWSSLFLIFAAISSVPLVAQDVPASEYAARRSELLRRLPDGVTLLHSETADKPESQPSFIQNPTFFYFTGQHGLPSAVLALDGTAHETVLFLPPVPSAFGFRVEGVVPEPGASAAALGVSRTAPLDSLADYLRARLAAGVTKWYVEAARRPESLGVPAGMLPVNGSRTLWATSLAKGFPAASIASATEVIRELRFVKSPAEVAILRSNARMTAAALRASIRSIRPGARQRAVEMRVAAACVDAGAVGPSFWPWTMSGPNAHVPQLVRSVYSYDQLDRTMQAGELVRVDIGCTNRHYGADVGRTVPVAGHFSAGQRETWNMLIAAYKAGMARIRAGVTIADVLATSRSEIERLRPSLRTPMGRQAADILLGTGGMAEWSIHSVGIDSGETPLETLAAGAVLAFEPIFSVGSDAFYLEDMILVTPTGSEVLSAGLPYTASEIEAAMRSPR